MPDLDEPITKGDSAFFNLLTIAAVFSVGLGMANDPVLIAAYALGSVGCISAALACGFDGYNRAVWSWGDTND